MDLVQVNGKFFIEQNKSQLENLEHGVLIQY